MILTLDFFYFLLGVMLYIIAVMSVQDLHNPRRYSTGMFWGLYSIVFMMGDKLPPVFVGVIVIIMAVVAGFGGVSLGKYNQFTDEQREKSAQRLSNKLFIPALIIPLVTMIGSVVVKDVKIGSLFLIDQKNFTLVSLGCGCILALVVVCWLTRATPNQGLREARRLIDSMGWAVVLPHMLAVLGLLFSDAGVGKAVSHVTTSYINMDFKLVAVAVYCIGMALFTMIMGNGFAAFPVMTAGIGIPVLINVFHGNPAVMSAIGMFSGYCGTLMTPMAANYNIVPATLLDLPDKNGVIKAQIPTALSLLIVNIFLMYFLM
jgi:uncharacterized membrane protein